MIFDNIKLYKPEAIMLIWALVYSSDWIMDWWGAITYQKKVKKICVFEKGYNVKAISEFESQHGKTLFLRYLSELLITSVAVWWILYSCRLMSSWHFYEFFCGAFIIIEACMHFRHIRNVAMFSLVEKKNGISGNIFLPKWISLRFAFTEFTTFALMLLIVYVFDPRNFFVLGGMFACMLTALYHLMATNRELSIFKKTNNNHK